jgi:hypothetical protein
MWRILVPARTLNMENQVILLFPGQVPGPEIWRIGSFSCLRDGTRPPYVLLRRPHDPRRAACRFTRCYDFCPSNSDGKAVFLAHDSFCSLIAIATCFACPNRKCHLGPMPLTKSAALHFTPFKSKVSKLTSLVGLAARRRRRRGT